MMQKKRQGAIFCVCVFLQLTNRQSGKWDRFFKIPSRTCHDSTGIAMIQPVFHPVHFFDDDDDNDDKTANRAMSSVLLVSNETWPKFS
jgi:hypothetical protein